jgi:hypothetical protein
MSEWNKFVKNHYHKEHNKDKSYSFKQALQDSAKLYKKQSANVLSMMGQTKKMKRRTGGKQGKRRRTSRR